MGRAAGVDGLDLSPSLVSDQLTMRRTLLFLALDVGLPAISF